MKAEELSIGLLVYVGHCHSNIGGDYDVEFVPEKLTLEHFKFWADNHWDKNDFDEFLKPISLTAEILEKNGFVNCQTIGEKFELRFHLDKNKYQVISYYLSTNELSIKTEYSYSLSPTIYLLRINYVHELQHALLLCGYKELSNNFKI